MIFFQHPHHIHFHTSTQSSSQRIRTQVRYIHSSCFLYLLLLQMAASEEWLKRLERTMQGMTPKKQSGLSDASTPADRMAPRSFTPNAPNDDVDCSEQNPHNQNAPTPIASERTRSLNGTNATVCVVEFTDRTPKSFLLRLFAFFETNAHHFVFFF